MNTKSIENLKKEGWEIGSVQDFLEFSDIEMKFVESKIKITLSKSNYPVNMR